MVQNRGREVIRARKLSSAMSAAKAIGDHLRLWCVSLSLLLLCLTYSLRYTALVRTMLKGTLNNGNHLQNAPFCKKPPPMCGVISGCLCGLYECMFMYAVR